MKQDDKEVDMGPCSYPGCSEPAEVLAGLHSLDTKTGEDVAYPPRPVCAQHLYVLYKMISDPEFRQKVLKAINVT